MNDINQDQVATTLAVNTGNMIASLNMQVAKLQVEHENQEKLITELRSQNKKLTVQLQKLKGGNKIEPLNNHINDK